jgi:hypothetical protein
MGSWYLVSLVDLARYGVVRMADLAVSEVAARLNVTPLTARRWRQAGTPSGFRCDGRGGCRIRERDLATVLDARCQGRVQARTPRPSLTP